MALNNLTRVTGSGFGTDTSINTAGIITATSFSGDGSALTGVVGSGSGVVVQEEGSNVGTAQTINFIGTGVTATLSGGIASIEITTSSGGGLSDIVSDTSPQLGGNLDVNGKDITGTGGVNLTGVVTATTFSGSAASLTSIPAGQLTGTISDGRLPSTITSDITGNVTGTATISTNVTVADESSDTSCFLLYSTEATGNIAPKTGSNLTFNSSSGTLTASTFVGDGSGLTGITASGSGVVVRDGGSLVGTAGTIDFGTNVSVSPISAGVVTVTAAAGTIVGINTSGTTELNNLTVAGVATANSFSGTSGSFTILNGGVNTAFHVDGGAPAMSLHVENDGEISVETTLKVGTAITMSSGIITATTFSGSGASLTTLNASELDSGTIPDARFPATLPAASGANLTNLPAANITGTLPAISGANLTNLDASDLASGTIPDARFPATLPAVSGANLTNLPSDTPADTDVQVTYDVSSNGSSGYRFTGPGYSGADDNPDIYLVRGQRYRFINGTGSGHPFRIQSDTSGTAYTDGVSGSQSGTQDFNVQHDAPVRLYYQCTIHSGMIGNIYIVGGSDWRMTDVATNATPEIFTNLNVGIGTDNPLFHLHVSSDSNTALGVYSNQTTGDQFQVATLKFRTYETSSNTAAAGDFLLTGKNTITFGGANRFIMRGDTGVSLGFYTDNTERLSITSGGEVQIANGNLKFSTAGTGIDFSANANATGMSSEVLDDYEEGTFTPTVSVEGQSNATTDKQYGRYVKIGKMVTVWCYVQLNGTPSGRGVNNAWQHGGLPFTKMNNAGGFDPPGPIIYWTIDSTSALNGTAPYMLMGRIFNNSSGGRIRAHDSSQNQSGHNASLLLKDNTEYSYSFTYEVA